jgi:hypothetical protein
MKRAVVLLLSAIALVLAGCTIPGGPPLPDDMPTLVTPTTLATSTALVPTVSPANRLRPLPTPALVPTANQGEWHGYLALFPDGVIFLEWTEEDGGLTGTIEVAQFDSPTLFGVAAQARDLTGFRSGSRVNLTIPDGLGLPPAVEGTIEGPTLTLLIADTQGVVAPYPFTAATYLDWDHAVARLREEGARRASQGPVSTATVVAQARASSATATAMAESVTATAAAAGQQQGAVNKANAALALALARLEQDGVRLQATATLDGPLRNYDHDWTQLQDAYATLRQQASKQPLDCAQLTIIQYQLGVVQRAHSAIKYDRAAFDAAVGVAKTSLGAVQQDIQAVQDAWDVLQQVAATNASGSPRPRYSQPDVNGAVQSAQRRIDAAGVGIDGAQGRASDYDTKADALDKMASDFVAAMTCVKVPTPSPTPPRPAR